MALAVRWGALCLALISAFAPISGAAGNNLRRDIIGASILVAYCIVRTLRPIRSGSSNRALLPATCTETALCVAVAFVTGGWSSPLLLMVGCSLLIAGLLGGLSALGASVVTVLVLVLAGEVAGTVSWLRGVRSIVAAQRIPELIVMGLVGAYVHRVFHNQGSRYNQIRWMNEVHALLFDLNTVAAENPEVFTLRGAVNATVARLREVLSADVVVVILTNPTAEGAEQPWEVVYSSGVELAALIREADLPTAILDNMGSGRLEMTGVIATGSGFDLAAVSGLYVPILTRGALVGLLALERRNQERFTIGDIEVVSEMARYAGLAIDNARSYLRLRNLGAEEERERIARELHDRVGQSLAAVAFNVDRIIASLPPGAPPGLPSELNRIAVEVRGVNAEIREKLAELRGGPSADLDLVRLLEGFLLRVEMRSKLNVSFDHQIERRLSDVVEREIWRIACEAIRNVERHSGAENLSVSLRNDGTATVLEVRDDGSGVSKGQLLRPDAFGFVGMRERADLIEATLVLDSVPNRGTTVRLRVPQR